MGIGIVRITLIGTALALLATGSAASQTWPDLADPPAKVGGGEGDAALVIGVVDYVIVPDVAGAGVDGGQQLLLLE